MDVFRPDLIDISLIFLSSLVTYIYSEGSCS